MCGIVGDATEGTKASAIITAVYNAGQIGDETYEIYGRHVGGIAGRLSGDSYRSFNTGDIYNGYSVVGGIVGYWVGGRIENVFNTGNITVLNNDQDAPRSKVGGLIGAFYTYDDEYSIKRADSILTLAYNLGTVRSFRPRENGKVNRVSGIVGSIDVANKLSISKVYTLGNLYAAEQNRDGSWSSTGEVELNQFSGGDALENSSYLYYIAPESNEFSPIQNE